MMHQQWSHWPVYTPGSGRTVIFLFCIHNWGFYTWLWLPYLKGGFPQVLFLHRIIDHFPVGKVFSVPCSYNNDHSLLDRNNTSDVFGASPLTPQTPFVLLLQPQIFIACLPLSLSRAESFVSDFNRTRLLLTWKQCFSWGMIKFLK